MELKANNPKISFDLDGNAELTVSIDKKHIRLLKSGYDKIKNKNLRIEVRQWRERRSLDANAYAWHLIGEIANTLSLEGHTHTKDEVYLLMLMRYGQGGILKVQSDSVEKFKRSYKYCEVHEKLFDEKAVYFKFWVGSSNYDTKEMSSFINGIVDEAHVLGVETKTPDELLRLVNLWGQAGVSKR